jgi:hypothetical protein
LLLFAAGGFNLLNLWRLPLSGDRTATPLRESKTSEFLSEFSPDGRWVAYTGTESAVIAQRSEVFVRSYPGLNGPWRISSSGGLHPKWSPDGRELYYSASDGTAIMAVDIKTDGTSISAGTPRVLIKTRLRTGHVPGGTPYDVSRDGRLLINEFLTTETSGGAAGNSSFTVVLNWASGL